MCQATAEPTGPRGFERLAQVLPVPREVAEAFEGVRPQVVATLDGTLFRRPDLGVLQGDASESVLRELNRYVTAYLGSVLILGLPELLTVGLPRVLAAYRGRGVTDDYLELLPELWRNAVEEQLGPRAAPLAPVLDWMVQHPGDWAAPVSPGGDEGGRTRLCGTLLAGDAPGARSLLQRALEKGASLPDVFVDLVQPALYEIGHRWEDGRITAAEEHLASALVARLLAGLEQGEGAGGERVAVVTTAPTETHEFGAWMVADVLRAAGWTVHFLGSQLPGEECLHFLRKVPCDLLAVSVTLEIHLPSLQRLMADLRTDDQLAGLPVLVGGQAFTSGERIWRATGADGLATDARDVVAQADALLRAAARRN